MFEFDNSKDVNHIDPSFVAIAGDKGQGKSTLIKLLAFERERQLLKIREQEASKGIFRRRTVLIHNANDSRAFIGIPEITINQIRYGLLDPTTGKTIEWREGVRQIKTNSLDKKGNEEIIKVIFQKMRNSFIFLDEANMWIPKRGEPKPWQMCLFTQHRNHCNYIYVMVHDLMDIHRDLRQHIFMYILFKIPNAFTSVRHIQRLKFPNPVKLYEKWCEIERTPHQADKKMQSFVIVKKDFSSRVLEDEPITKTKKTRKKSKSKK